MTVMTHLKISLLLILIFYLNLQWCFVRGMVLYPPDNVCVPNPPQPFAKPEIKPDLKYCRTWIKEGMRKGHPDRYKNTGQILSTYKYAYQVYKVTTEDNYILTVYRIKGSPNLPSNQYKKRKQVVLLLHGLTLAADCWFFQPGNRNLPFKLADAGYEVWLLSARGTTYSQQHKRLKADKDLEYWNFSWHEMGVYDLPAVTNKMLKVTGNKKIFFVGHSMACTAFLVSAAVVPEMNKKVHASFMLAPQAFMGHMNNPSRALMVLIDKDEKFQIFNTILRGRFHSSKDIRKMGLNPGDLCDASAVECGTCDNLLFSIMGYNAPHMNSSIVSFLFTKAPNTFPLKAMAHYAQITLTCTFRHYDYGDLENLKRYGQITPPDYNLQNIKIPTYFFHSKRDNFAPPNDVNITARKLKPGILKAQYLIWNDYFTHADYALAKDADVLVYNHILEHMKEYKESKE